MELLKTHANIRAVGLTHLDTDAPIHIRARPDSAKVVGATKNRLTQLAQEIED